MPDDIVLIHISDLHIFDQGLSLRKLIQSHGIASKRTLGWINHQFNRGEHFSQKTIDALFNYLDKSDWDYLIVSGDVTTLSLDDEFKIAREYLAPIIDKKPVLFVPGNHDRYTPSVFKPDLMARVFKDCFPFNQKSYGSGSVCHQYLGDRAVVFSIETAVPRSHLSSRGKLLTDPSKLESFLKNLDSSMIKIAYGHYPVVTPPDQKDGYLHGLEGKEELKRIFKDHPVDLYLHGHIHKTWRYETNEYPGTIWINSGGCCRYSQGEWSGFHKIILTDTGFTVHRSALTVQR